MSNDQRGKPPGPGAPPQGWPQQQGGWPQQPGQQPAAHHGPPQMPAPQHGHPQHPQHPQHGAPQMSVPQQGHAQHPQQGHAQHPQHGPPQHPQHGHPQQPQHGHGAPQMPAQAPSFQAMHGAPPAGWQAPPHGAQAGWQPHAQAPLPPAVANQPGHSPQVPAEAGMFKRSLGRAFRLRIEPEEVSPKERAALLAANPPITVPYLQAFLAWRRSVLFLVAFALLPLTILRFAEAFSDDMPDELRFLVAIPAAAEAFLCLVCWYQLKNWTHWRQQRRALLKAWVLFMAAPFIVFLIPIDAVLESMVAAPVASAAGDGWGDQAGAVAAEQTAAIAVAKTIVAIYALITLAPKAVSLVAGTVRAGIVTKMLFPGTSGPGWIVVIATPLYALVVFTLLIVPYQLTGSGWFMGAMISLAVGQITFGRAGYTLAKPMTHDDAVKIVRKARAVYVLSMLSFAVCLLVALAPLAEKMGVDTVITTALSFQANVMLLTLIGSDLVITGLARSRGLSTGTTHLVDESNQQLSAFVGS